MDISKAFRKMICARRRKTAFSETLLDGWIEDALREEVLSQAPSTTWERLRQMLEERRKRRYGMWVLDEPLHDPPRVFGVGETVSADARSLRERYRAVQPYTAESVVVHLTFALSAFI